MILTGLRLQNFQSHGDTRLELVPGVNVIVGPNDVGKSAILRAVKAVVYFADMDTRVGTEESLVALEFVDGTITRLRREKNGKLVAGGQEYRLDPAHGKSGQIYKKLGRTLPPEVVKILNMAQVVFEDGTVFSLNVAEQIPSMGPFLIGGGFNGQARVKILGSVTEQHLFDEGARRAKNDGVSASKEAKTLEKLLQEARDERDRILEEPDYQGLHKAAIALREQAETIRKRLEKHQVALERLKNAKEALDAIRETKKRLPDRARTATLSDYLGTLDRRVVERTAALHAVAQRHRNLGAVREGLGRLPDLHRLGSLLRRAEDLAARPGSSVLARLRAAEQRVVSIRGDGSQPRSAYVRTLLERAETLYVRTADRSVVLHRHHRSSEQLDIERARSAEVETKFDGLRFELAELLMGLDTCPYAPSEIEFQAACKKKLRV